MSPDFSLIPVLEGTKNAVEWSDKMMDQLILADLFETIEVEINEEATAEKKKIEIKTKAAIRSKVCDRIRLEIQSKTAKAMWQHLLDVYVNKKSIQDFQRAMQLELEVKNQVGDFYQRYTRRIQNINLLRQNKPFDLRFIGAIFS